MYIFQNEFNENYLIESCLESNNKLGFYMGLGGDVTKMVMDTISGIETVQNI